MSIDIEASLSFNAGFHVGFITYVVPASAFPLMALILSRFSDYCMNIVDGYFLILLLTFIAAKLFPQTCTYNTVPLRIYY